MDHPGTEYLDKNMIAKDSSQCDGNFGAIVRPEFLIVPDDAVVNCCPQRNMRSRKVKACLTCPYFIGVKETKPGSLSLPSPQWMGANHVICTAPMSRSMTISPLED